MITTVNIQVDKDEVMRILHEINRKLLLLEGEKEAEKRKVIIDSILDEDDCEIVRLKRLLGIGVKEQ